MMNDETKNKTSNETEEANQTGQSINQIDDRAENKTSESKMCNSNKY